MTSTKAQSVANEMVPLADRLRYMRFCRLGLLLAMVGLFALSPEVFTGGRLRMAEVTAAYMAIALACEGLWHLWGRRGITLFGSLIILDGLYLAWVCYVSGGIASPARYAMLLHLIAVVLLASYRTGLKVALWDSLLTLLVFYAQDVRMSVAVGGRTIPDSPFHRLVVFVVLFWLVALVTAAFSAVNERELRRRKYDLEALAHLAKDLDVASGAREAAEILTDHVAEAFDFDCVVLVGESQGQWSLLAHYGPVAGSDVRQPMSAGSVLERARAQKETVLVSGVAKAADPWLSELLPGGRNLVVMPLHAEGHCQGVLVAEHAMRHGSRIERRVVSMLERFASHGGDWGSAVTTALGAGNVDTIFGFVSGSDKIVLDDAVFAGIGPLGSLAAGSFVTGSAAADAEDRIIYNAATGALLYDADGNGAGAAVQFATLGGSPALAASDFMVI